MTSEEGDFSNLGWQSVVLALFLEWAMQGWLACWARLLF